MKIEKNKETVLQIRLSSTEKDLIKKQAKAKLMNMSDYLRTLVLADFKESILKK